ncbi:MAG: DUF1540 domain-containing protein [Romboutsia sp.]
MSSINCNVNNCSHNNSGECYANKITVNGKKSRTSTHTCCSSFLDGQNYGTLTNNTNGGGACSSIECNVKTCNYNSSSICSLDNISVSTELSKANLYAETYCSSFKCK